MTTALVFKENKSGKRPFAEDVLVDYRLRSGAEGTKAAGQLQWGIGSGDKTVETGEYETHPGDIVSYRKHVSTVSGEVVEEPEQPLDTVDTPDAE